jgi:hypothetical protein
MQIKRLTAAASVAALLTTGMLTGAASASTPPQAGATDRLVKIPSVRTGFLASSLLSWPAVADPGAGVTTDSYSLGATDGVDFIPLDSLTTAPTTTIDFAFPIGNSFFGFAGLGVAAGFSDATTSPVTFFKVRPIPRPLAMFRFSFPAGSSDLAQSAEAGQLDDLETSLRTFATQCGMDVPTTHLSVTVVGRQSPAERTPGLALARATSVAERLTTDFTPDPSPGSPPSPVSTAIATATAPVPARAMNIPTQSATVKIRVTTTPSPSCP